MRPVCAQTLTAELGRRWHGQAKWQLVLATTRGAPQYVGLRRVVQLQSVGAAHPADDAAGPPSAGHALLDDDELLYSRRFARR